MFSGIVERMVSLVQKEQEGSNMHFTFKTDITDELKIDQSIAHNGVCLTVTDISDNHYKVTAIDETLKLTNLGGLNVGDEINVERCLKISDRLDGHIVQGHVDGLGEVVSVNALDGSWEFGIKHNLDSRLILHKGSITINGVSLTVIHTEEGLFKVAIIPYTHEHTNFHNFKVGTKVNLELDVLGKYVASLSGKL